MRLIKQEGVEAVEVTLEAIGDIAEWLSPSRPGYFHYGDGPFRFRGPQAPVVAANGQWIVKHGETVRVMSGDALREFLGFSAED